jgi:hypothetical protein
MVQKPSDVLSKVVRKLSREMAFVSPMERRKSDVQLKDVNSKNKAVESVTSMVLQGNAARKMVVRN